MSSYLSVLQASLASFVGELFALVYTGFGLGMWFPELARRAPPQTFEGQLRRRVVAGSPLAENDRVAMFFSTLFRFDCRPCTVANDGAHCFVLIVDPLLSSLRNSTIRARKLVYFVPAVGGYTFAV